MRALTVLVLAFVAMCALTAVEGNKMDNYHKRTGGKWLEKKERETGVLKLKSGMLFKVIKKGTSDKSPGPDDDCSVHYTGTLKDGTKFDSSVDRGEPATFKPTQVIKGWTEALQLMREGDKWEVYIPYDMAYGAHGSPPKIPGHSPLSFQMELLKVKAAGKKASECDEKILEQTGKKYEDIEEPQP